MFSDFYLKWPLTATGFNSVLVCIKGDLVIYIECQIQTSTDMLIMSLKNKGVTYSANTHTPSLLHRLFLLVANNEKSDWLHMKADFCY